MGKIVTLTGTSSGAEYELLEEIGRGVQGRVFSIKGGNYAFKLIGKKTGSKSKLLTRKISYIKTRPLEDLPISRPIEQVDGEALGYIMEMATEMMSLEELVKPDDNFVGWWNKTGGLRKRLLILKGVAETLAKLHSRGLVYGDLSFKNIFVSKDADYSEIFMIDTDNITHDSKVGSAVYTPGYGAPEIIQNDKRQPISGYDTYTDDYSFAIIAYQLLTLNHPFIGDYVNNGEPELEEDAYMGLIPWINHSTDTINIATSGIPNTLTISPKMLKAFRETFEAGITQKQKRTSTLKWAEIFEGAVNALLDCQNKDCLNNFYFSSKLLCPFCKDKMKYIGSSRIFPLLKSLVDEAKFDYSVSLSDQSNTGNPILTRLMTPGKYVIFTEHDFYLNNSQKQLFQIKILEDSVYLKGLNLETVSIISNKKYSKTVNIGNEIKVVLKGEFIVFFEELKKYQRILKVFKKS